MHIHGGSWGGATMPPEGQDNLKGQACLGCKRNDWLVEPLIVWKRPWPLRSVSPKMLTLASFRPSMRLTADGRGKPHTLTYASDHLPCRSRAEGHLALHDRGFRQFDGCFIRAPQGEAWT